MKGGGWKGSLFIACSAPQASLRRHAAGGLHRATALKKPILKQSQSQTLTLETGTRLHTSGSTFYSPVFWVFFHTCPSKRLESSLRESKFTRGPCLNPFHACEGWWATPWHGMAEKFAHIKESYHKSESWIRRCSNVMSLVRRVPLAQKPMPFNLLNTPNPAKFLLIQY